MEFVMKLTMRFKIFRFQIGNQIRRMSSSKPKDHYDALGITPKSTQGEIKSAYYKLSMVYHPDKNQNASAQAAQKFRDITEAYEVLGNVKSRKLYDKGLYFRSAPTVTNEEIDKFYKSREMRSKPPPPSGKTPIYDFDEWSKSHYGATFKRQMENKNRARLYKMARQQEKNDLKLEKMLLFLLGLSIISLCFFKDRSESKYDTVFIHKKPTIYYSKESSD